MRGIGVNVFPGHSQNRLHLQIFQKSLRTLVWHLYLLKRVHPACGGTSGSSNLTSFRSTMRRTSSCTLPTPMSRSMATSRCSSDFYVSVNFWLNFAPYQSMCGLDSREGWTKNWNSKSTLALSFYFWQFFTGEWWNYCRLEQKNLEKCYRWDFFILDPKKSKKSQKMW